MYMLIVLLVAILVLFTLMWWFERFRTSGEYFGFIVGVSFSVICATAFYYAHRYDKKLTNETCYLIQKGVATKVDCEKWGSE